MSIDQILQLLDIFVWPCTVLIVIVLLRKLIKELIPFVQRVRYGGIEVEFSEKVEQISSDMAEDSPPETAEETEKSTLHALVDISPESAVIQAWKGVEEAAQEKVRQLVPENENYKQPINRPIDYLDHKGALVPSSANAARELRILRNEAAHAGAGAISRESAIQYISVANRVRAQIEAIVELPAVKLTALTLLILELNHLIDSGKYEDITIDEVYGWIESESILPSLRERTAGDSDLSMLGSDGPYSNFSTFYHNQMSRLAGGYAGEHRRKLGVENLGLCLLLLRSTLKKPHSVSAA